MKSSSIALLHRRKADTLQTGNPPTDILVNLIDSPGHVDFCSEVSTAARLSDGALVVIDVVEGVCIQTHAVLRQAWEEQVELTLVLNKIDRLILEVQLTPEQAYQRIKAIIEQVNNIVSAFQSEQYISETDAILASHDVSAQTQARDSEGEDAVDEKELDFSPEKGNVAFASAHDGWAFRTSQFAPLCASKLGVNPDKLAGILWGDWAYDSKTKRAVNLRHKKDSKLKPLFVQMILGTLWKAYEAAEAGADTSATLSKIISSLQLKVNSKSLSYQEPRKALRQVLQAWLPLADAILDMASDQLPDPVTAAKNRCKRLLPIHVNIASADANLLKDLERVREAVSSCSTSPDAPTMVYVSKMIAVPASLLPRLPGQPAPADLGSDVFLAFARVFSGQLKDGDTVQVLSAAYNPLNPDQDRQEVKVKGIYMMMGRGLERLQTGHAGNVVAIGGLETAILKSATLSSTKHASPIAPMIFQASAIAKVAVEPANPTQMPQLMEGLQLLNRADPFVEVSVQETGEHVVGAAGEVHLEMCIKDLKERFARIDLQVSPPLVAFRESCFYPAESLETVPKPPKVVEGQTANGLCTIRVRANALPRQLASLLDDNGAIIKRSLVTLKETEKHQTQSNGHTPDTSRGSKAQTLHQPTELQGLRDTLAKLLNSTEGSLKDIPPELKSLLAKAWLLGPHQTGPNILTNSCLGTTKLFDVPPGQVEQLTKRTGGEGAASLGQEHLDDSRNGDLRDVPLGNCQAASLLGLTAPEEHSRLNGSAAEDVSGSAYVQRSIESGIAAGYQLATASGPLCDEPLWGLAFEVEARVLSRDTELSSGSLQEDIFGPISGQVTSVARQLFRRALMEADPRLVEAMFLCEVSTSSDGLSGTYAVLGQRRARILSEVLREGSGLFSIHAFLPAEASFGFADDMRRKSSGAASASLLLSHWERLQVDPFFVPLTEEQREEFGEEGQGVGAPNLANILVDKVRRRKGLPVGQKVVESSTKQRTRARKV